MAASHTYGAPPQMPVAVISPQFCAPYAVPLTVIKKAISLSKGDFVVTDANGAEMLRVKGAVFTMHDRRVLRDAAGQPLVSMRHKVRARARTASCRAPWMFYFSQFFNSIRPCSLGSNV